MAPVHGEDPLFYLETLSHYIALPASTLGTPYESLCASVFSPLLLTYYPPARGIVLSYSNVRLSSNEPSKKRVKRWQQQHEANGSQEADEQGEEELSLKADEYSCVYAWATATLLVFRPVKNAWVMAHVASQSQSHLELSYLNTFSISVLAAQLPGTWKWNSNTASQNKKGKAENGDDSIGYWTNEDGFPVDGEINVRITEVDFRSSRGGRRGFFGIVGSLRAEEEEEQSRGQDQGEGREEAAGGRREDKVRKDKSKGKEKETEKERKKREKRERKEKRRQKKKGILKESSGVLNEAPESMEVDG